MHTITAIIRARPDGAAALGAALLAVAAEVAANEPGTLGFFVSVDAEDPCVFTTYERFVDAAAMDAHNGSPAVARFFAVAAPLLDGPVTLVTAREISAKKG